MSDLYRAAIAAGMATALGILCAALHASWGALACGFAAGVFIATAAVIQIREDAQDTAP